jgi:hypothetical protein
MSRFKHRLKEPFGKAGLTVAIIALVMALVGGAYAAGGLTKSQEKQVTKIAKKYAGKTGPAGPAGPAGAAGPAGTNGTNGKNGTSVTSEAATAGECPEGGTKFTAGASTSKVCNGSPWTAGGTLPSKATETGAWSVRAEGQGVFPVSFTIPLAAALNGTHVHIAPNAECPGSSAEPKANPGNLCVYVGRSSAGFSLTNVIKASGLELGADTAGATIAYELEGAGFFPAGGTWAVTAE